MQYKDDDDDDDEDDDDDDDINNNDVAAADLSSQVLKKLVQGTSLFLIKESYSTWAK